MPLPSALQRVSRAVARGGSRAIRQAANSSTGGFIGGKVGAIGAAAARSIPWL